jgi:hypothetical protein
MDAPGADLGDVLNNAGGTRENVEKSTAGSFVHRNFANADAHGVWGTLAARPRRTCRAASLGSCSAPDESGFSICALWHLGIDAHDEWDSSSKDKASLDTQVIHGSTVMRFAIFTRPFRNLSRGT